MGIKRLLPFLAEHGAIKPLSTLAPGVKAAIDVPIFAQKFIYAERTFDGLQRRFLRFGSDLRAQGIEPTFVFDGTEKLALKDRERAKRAVARDKQLDRAMAAAATAVAAQTVALDAMDIELVGPSQGPTALGPPAFTGILFPTRSEYVKLETILNDAGFLVARAKYEAEALCAKLTRDASVDVVITEDTDAIAFGATRVVFKWGTPEAVEYVQSEALAKLGITYEQVVDLCAMFGCDFCDNVYKIGPANAFKLLVKHGSWPKVYETQRYGWPQQTRESGETFHELYPEVFKCFTTQAYESCT